MQSKLLIKIFYKRFIDINLKSIIFYTPIFALLVILSLGVTLPLYTMQSLDLEEISYEIQTNINNNNTDQLDELSSFSNDIIQSNYQIIFVTLRLEDYTNIEIMGIDASLMDRLNLNQQQIYSFKNDNLGNFSITDAYYIFVDEILNLSFEKDFNDIDLPYGYNMVNFPKFLLSMSSALSIYQDVHVPSKTISTSIISDFVYGWEKDLDYAGVEQLLIELKKNILLELAQLDIKDQDVKFISRVENKLERIQKSINYQINAIQFISIPNIIIIFLFFSVPNPSNIRYEKFGRHLVKKGTSTKYLRMLFFTIETFNVLVSFIIATVIAILIRYTLNLPSVFISQILQSSILILTLITILNLRNILNYNLNPQIDSHEKSDDQVSKPRFELSRKKITYLTISILVIHTLLVILPKLYYPVYMRTVHTYLNLLMLGILLIIGFKNISLYSDDRAPDTVDGIVYRILKKGRKHIKFQFILIFSIFLLLVISVNFQIITNQEISRFDSKVGDIKIYSDFIGDKSFLYEDILGIENEIEGIKDYLISTHGTYEYYNSYISVNFINPEFYTDPDHHKSDHFYGKETNGIVHQLIGKNAIISYRDARILGVDVGDQVSFDIEFWGIEQNGSPLMMRADNYTVIGIIDCFDTLDETMTGIIINIDECFDYLSAKGQEAVFDSVLIDIEDDLVPEDNKEMVLQKYTTDILEYLNATYDDTYITFDGTTTSPSIESLSIFIGINVLFAGLILPLSLVTVIRMSIKDVSKQLRQLERRGVSKTMIGNLFSKSLRNDLFISILSGSLWGAILGNSWLILLEENLFASRDIFNISTYLGITIFAISLGIIGLTVYLNRVKSTLSTLW
jgi:hypothetical protein